MTHQGPFDQSHLIMSYELLQLLEWLLDNEQEEIKRLIACALSHGFKTTETERASNNNKEMHNTIIEFFSVMDALLHETIYDDKSENVLQRQLVPAINNVDTTLYDCFSVQTSIEKATAAAERHSGNAKEVLCKELLKRWKPSKGIVVN